MGRDERAVDLRKGMTKVRVLEWSSEKGAWEGFGSGMRGQQGRNKGTRGDLRKGE